MVNFRKNIKKSTRYVRKGIRKIASKAVSTRRKYGIVKKGKISTMGVTKALANLSFKTGATSEYKLLDQNHNTLGSPDASTRYFYQIQSSANEATESTTTTLGTAGYLLRQINFPTAGDSRNNYDGQKFGIDSITWKGMVSITTESNQFSSNGTLRLMLVRYNLKDSSAFDMSDFLQTDHNGEYSMTSRREEEHYKDYTVLQSKVIRLNAGSKTSSTFNIYCPIRKYVQINTDGTVNDYKYFCVGLVSGDIGPAICKVNYNGSTRMRFIA